MKTASFRLPVVGLLLGSLIFSGGCGKKEKLAREAEAQRMAEEQIARAAEARRLEEEQAAAAQRAAEAARIAAEQAAQAAEEQRLAEEKLRAEAEARQRANDDALAALQGDWRVIPKNQNWQFPEPPSFIRIRTDSCIVRMQAGQGIMGGWDTDTGESLNWVKDDDGTSYLEHAHYQMTVSADTSPWHLTLTKTRKDGTLVEKKGLGRMEGGMLWLWIGKPGEEPPDSLALEKDYTFKAQRAAAPEEK